MIRVLLAINFGLAVAATFAILEALGPPQRRQNELDRQAELAEMIVDLSGYFEGVDLSISPEDVDATLFGGEPVTIQISGHYDGWPYDTITEDALN